MQLMKFQFYADYFQMDKRANSKVIGLELACGTFLGKMGSDYVSVQLFLS